MTHVTAGPDVERVLGLNTEEDARAVAGEFATGGMKWVFALAHASDSTRSYGGTEYEILATNDGHTAMLYERRLAAFIVARWFKGVEL